MKRYYMVRDELLPTVEQDFGNWHYIDLASHGSAGDKWNLVCLCDNHIQPGDGWLPFPPMYDAKTTLEQSPVLQECLADIGLTGQETCIEAVVKLGEIHPCMGV